MFFLSVRMKQLCYHWADFHEIWYLRIFRKSRNSSLIKMWQGLRKQIVTFVRECEKIRQSQKCHSFQCNAAAHKIIYRHQMGELNNRTDFTQEPSCCPTQNFMFSLRYASRILKHPAEDVGKAREKKARCVKLVTCSWQWQMPFPNTSAAKTLAAGTVTVM